MEVDDSPPFFAHHNWDDILHQKSLHDLSFPDRAMESAHPPGSYPHQELDSPLTSLQNPRLQRSQMSSLESSPSGLDPNYDLFSSAARFRSYSNASSTLSSYAVPDLFYSNPSSALSEGVDPASSYEAGHTLPSAFTPSPVSPQENTLHRPSYHFSTVPGMTPAPVDKVSQEYGSHPAFNELMLDRRPSNPEHFDDFGLNMPNFGAQNRVSGFSPEFSSNGMPIRPKPSLEMFRHVAPQATHGFKVEPSSSGFQDGFQYGMGGAQSDLALRLPVTAMGVDETLSRMKLQPPPGAGGTDLQSFIRLAFTSSFTHLCSVVFPQPILGTVHDHPQSHWTRRACRDRHV